jgi:predicted amidophosphoribosyltransferase
VFRLWRSESAESRFCGACRASLAAPPICSLCHAPAQPGQRFCNACGANAATPVVIAFHAGRDGRIDRLHHYNVEQIGAALARFAELSAERDQAPEDAPEV